VLVGTALVGPRPATPVDAEPAAAPQASPPAAVAANPPAPAPPRVPRQEAPRQPPAQPPQPPARPVAPDLDKLLQEVIDGKIDRRMLCVELSCGGKTADEQGFVRLYGNGAGIWDPHSGKRGVATRFGKPFTLPEAEVSELLKRLKAVRLGPM